MIEAVAFDLDDTLYDEVDYCASGFRAVADFIARSSKARSSQGTFDALWGQFVGGNRTRTFNAALDGLGIEYDQNVIENLVQVYRNHSPRISLPDDSRDVLSELSSKYTLGLLTDGFLPAQRLKVQALAIERYFKAIIYTEELGREFWKPAPAAFCRLMEMLNCRAESVAYVADNENKDFIAPNRLGIASIQILRSRRIHTEHSDLDGAAARFRIERLTELPGLLERI